MWRDVIYINPTIERKSKGFRSARIKTDNQNQTIHGRGLSPPHFELARVIARLSRSVFARSAATKQSQRLPRFARNDNRYGARETP